MDPEGSKVASISPYPELDQSNLYYYIHPL
jgi:hypothetical protein